MSLVVACTAPNPAFGDGTADATGGKSESTTFAGSLETGSATRTTSEESLEPETRGTTQDSSDGNDERGDDPSASTTDAPRVDGGSRCETEGHMLDVEVSIDGLSVDLCGMPVPLRGLVAEIDGDMISISTCVSCELCEGGGGPVALVEVTGFAIPDGTEVGRCVDVVVTRDPLDDCAFRALAISRLIPNGNWVPAVAVAHDTFDIPQHPGAPNGFHVPFVETLCQGMGCDQAGQYVLGFGDASYAAGDKAEDVNLFGRPELFDLDVRDASIDAECVNQVAWVASLAPSR